MKKAQSHRNELQEAVSYYQQLFEESREAIMIIKTDQTIYDVNNAAASLTGYAKTSLIGMNVQTLYGNIQPPCIQHKDALFQGKTINIDTQIIHKNGHLIAVDVSCGQIKIGNEKYIHSIVRNITELEKIKGAYEEKQRFLTTLINNIPGIVYRCQNTKDWPIIFFNQGDIDKTSFDFSNEMNASFNLNDFIHPDDRDAVWVDTQAAVKNHEVYHLSYRLKLTDGHYIWVADHGSAVYSEDDQVLFLEGFITDISKQKKAELLVQKSEEKFRLLFENAQVGMIRFDIKTSITLEANDSAAAILGYQCGKELVGELLRKHYYNISLIETLYKSFRKQGFIKNADLQVIKKDKTLTWVNVSCWHAADERGTANAIIIDINDYKHSQEQLSVKSAQLVQADKLAALGTLVAGVGHEISNPTSYITMNTPILKDAWEDVLPILEEYATTHGDFKMAGLNFSELKQEIPSICTDILNRAKNINKMVMDLKDFSRERPVNLWEKVNINDVLKLALVLTNNTIKKATKKFRLKYSKNIPLIVGNSQRLEQVIINLIVNACQSLKHTDKGIFISTEHDQENHQVVLTVKDEGVGISPKNLALIFDPFFTTKQEKGTGLGLSISYGIVQEHHGELEIKSELNQGTEAKIILPIKC